jgi:hypothetical protein
MLLNFIYQNNTIEFKRVTRPISSFREEVYNTAKLIYANAPNPLVVGYSGGKDSELICHVLHQLQIPFKPLVIRYEHDKDSIDMKYIMEFCNKREIEPIIIDVDAMDFYTNSVERYIEQGYRAINLFRYLQILLMETAKNMGYTCILGSPDYRFRTFQGKLLVPFDSDIITPLQWCERNNTVHYPFFYYATSELFASYLREELIQLVVNDGGYHNSLVTGFMPEKELIYRKYFGELKNRLKTVGFEKITKFREEKENELASRFSDLNNYNMYMNINKIKSQLGI